ncbi:MAG: hypothetical protein JW794_03190 [Candidatus Cloacimonetes bacterium]|nr:hypothetical protein [Candidatus Cloacimonadota bacterium]
MKTIIFTIILLSVLIFPIQAKTLNPNPNEAIPFSEYPDLKIVPFNTTSNRENYPVPDFSFKTVPTTIMTSYYDYMPGSYEGFPYGLQSTIGSGYYLTWFGTASTTANRRQYYAYINSSGVNESWGTISNYDIWQGYGNCTVHPATGDCFATWHEDGDATGYFGTTFVYDDYALLGIPGFWSTVTYLPPNLPDEYNWPYFYVGPSPMGTDYLRLYQVSKNFTNDAWENPCEDMRIMYIDLENTPTADLSPMLNMANWTTQWPMYYWRYKSCRPYSQAFAIDYENPGRVAIIGYAVWLEGDLGDMPVDEGFFVWESNDYGTTWDGSNIHGDGPGEIIYVVENIPQFEDNSGNIVDEVEVQLAGCHNTAVYDNDGSLHLTFLQQYGFTDDAGDFYYYNHFLPQAEAVWTGTEWEYHEVPGMPGIDPWSGHTVPWEIVGNDTILYTTVGFSKYTGTSNIFHENNQRNTVNLDNNWMVQLWSDGTYVQLAEDGDPAYQAYAEHPILYISVSSDNGQTWSDVIELTDIYSTLYNFSNEITVYPNLSNHIVDMGNNYGLVYLYYYDDNSFGSFAQSGQGQNTGGQLNYCEVQILFPDSISIDPAHYNPISLVSNNPNPFFETTRINFTTKKTYQEAAIKIYNPKGQLINTLEVNHGGNPFEGFGIWNGKDLKGKDVTNGIYLYRVEVDGSSYVNKMLLAR